MNILSIHNKYLIRGGEDESRELEEKILRENGHFVYSYIESNQDIKKIGYFKTGLRTIWSHKSYREVKKILKNHRFDIVHVQNFFPLISPSVYYAAKDMDIPVVQTLRNYRLKCLNGLFYKNDSVCELCLRKKIPWNGLINKCYRNSYLWSSGIFSMLAIHNFLKTWQKKIDLFITPTNFAKNKFAQGGIPKQKIIVKPNFIYPDPGIGHGDGKFLIFVGRLEKEKGINTLIEAWKKVNVFNEDISLKIIGEGSLKGYIKNLAKTLKGLEYLGLKSNEETCSLIGKAIFLLFPSEWYETFGRVLIESFAKGTPVIATDIGSASEIVVDGKTGFIFKPGDSDALSSRIKVILNNQDNKGIMRSIVRKEYEKKYTADANYNQLMQIYKSLL